MISPRATIINSRRIDAKEEVEVSVRAGSKLGAILSARIAAARFIPFRDQQMMQATSEDNERFFNVWKVRIRDKEVINSRWS